MCLFSRVDEDRSPKGRRGRSCRQRIRLAKSMRDLLHTERQTTTDLSQLQIRTVCRVEVHFPRMGRAHQTGA